MPCEVCCGILSCICFVYALCLSYSPVQIEPESQLLTSDMRAQISPHGSIRQMPSSANEHGHHATSNDVHYSQQQQYQQVRVGGEHVASGGGPGQRGDHRGADDIRAETAPRKVRTLVCDDDVDNHANDATTRRSYTAVYTIQTSPKVSQLPSSFRQPHCVHSPPGSPHPTHITSSQSSPSFSLSVTPSTFHSRLKTHLFHKSFPP